MKNRKITIKQIENNFLFIIPTDSLDENTIFKYTELFKAGKISSSDFSKLSLAYKQTKNIGN